MTKLGHRRASFAFCDEPERYHRVRALSIICICEARFKKFKSFNRFASFKPVKT